MEKKANNFAHMQNYLLFYVIYFLIIFNIPGESPWNYDKIYKNWQKN
jgi:hypothetical protein